MDAVLGNKYTFIFVLIRISMVLTFGVFFGDKRLLKRANIVLIVAISLLLTPVVDFQYENSLTKFEFMRILVTEILIGFSIGYISKLLTYIMSTAGSIIDIQGGFSIAQVYDPSTQNQVSVVSSLFSLITLLCFLLNDFHLVFLDIVMDSFKYIPIGSMIELSSILRLATTCITIATCIALPIIGVIFIIDVVLGIAAKTIPQINIFSVGYIIKTATTVILIYFYTIVLNKFVINISNMLFTFLKQL